MRNKQRYCGQLQNHVRIVNFCEWIREITIHSKSSYFCMVLWHGWSCKEVCGTILWVGRQDDSTTLQSIYSMHRWPPLQRRRNKICLRIVKFMLSIFLKCFYLARVGRPDILWSENKLEPSITKWTKAWVDWFHLFIILVNTNNTVMWEILLNNADWDSFKTLTSREILKIRNPLLEEHCVSLEVTHLFQ